MNAVRAFVSRHTDMFTSSHASSKIRMSVASPVSPLRRHTNPSDASATAFTGSSPSAKSLSCSESSGAVRRPMFTWASSWRVPFSVVFAVP